MILLFSQHSLCYRFSLSMWTHSFSLTRCSKHTKKQPLLWDSFPPSCSQQAAHQHWIIWSLSLIIYGSFTQECWVFAAFLCHVLEKLILACLLGALKAGIYYTDLFKILEKISWHLANLEIQEPESILLSEVDSQAADSTSEDFKPYKVRFELKLAFFKQDI